MLEKTIIDMLKNIPMPKRISFANTFLRMPDFTRSEITSTIEFDSLVYRVNALREAHDLTDYKNAKEIRRVHPVDKQTILPRNKIYAITEEFFSLLPEFKFYLQQVHKEYKNNCGLSVKNDYSPLGIDECLLSHLSAVNKIGFRSYFDKTLKYFASPLKDIKTFFWHERKTSSTWINEPGKYDAADGHYPCLKAYCREVNLTLDKLKKGGINYIKNNREKISQDLLKRASDLGEEK